MHGDIVRELANQLHGPKFRRRIDTAADSPGQRRSKEEIQTVTVTHGDPRGPGGA